MQTPIQQKTLGRIEVLYPHRVKNTTPLKIPAYGIMQIVTATTSAEETIYGVAQTSVSGAAMFLLNGPQAIAAGGYGAATSAAPALAAYSAFNATPIGGQEWGPIPGSWLLSQFGKGFLIVGGAAYVGGAANGTVRVAPLPPSSNNNPADFPTVTIINSLQVAFPFGTIIGYGVAADPPNPLNFIPVFNSSPPVRGVPICVAIQDIAGTPFGGGIVGSGRAAPVGVVTCQVDMKDFGHGFADAITNDYTKLQSSEAGDHKIIWRERVAVSGPSSLGVQWCRVLLNRRSEAPRLIRGKAYQPVLDTTKTFEIVALDPLASGRDPRDDPTDATARIRVANVFKSTYAQDDWVDAAYNRDAHLVVGDIAANKADWEALPNGSGGVGTTRYAIVTSLAAKNGGLGKAVILGEDLQPTASDPIEFKNVQQYAACRLSTRVILQSPEQLVPGSLFADKKVFGTLVDVADYLVDLQGAAPKKSLVLPEGGSAAANVQWLGGEC